MKIWGDKLSMENFEKTCCEEMDRMSKELVCSDRTIIFFDILKKPLEKVAVYLNVDDVKRGLEVNLGKNFEFTRVYVSLWVILNDNGEPNVKKKLQ